MQEHVVVVRPQPGPYPTDTLIEELGRAALAAVRGEAITLRLERGVTPELAEHSLTVLRTSIRKGRQLVAEEQQKAAVAAAQKATVTASTAHLATMPPMVTAQDLRNHLAGCTEPTCVFRAMAAYLGVK